MHRNKLQVYSWILHLSDPDTDVVSDIKKETHYMPDRLFIPQIKLSSDEYEMPTKAKMA